METIPLETSDDAAVATACCASPLSCEPPNSLNIV
jgi:hypothetical protein